VVGFWQGGTIFGVCVNSSKCTYAIATSYKNGRNGGFQFQQFELPMGVRLESNAQGNVYGCGILIDPDNKLITFFTLNGFLLGQFFFGLFYKYNLEDKLDSPNEFLHI
jgi:hypothetical protein